METADKINSMQKLWKAVNYGQFSDMSIKEINKFVGSKKIIIQIISSKTSQVIRKNSLRNGLLEIKLVNQ